MTGPIAMGGSKITTLADATNDGDAVNFKQMKDANDNYLPLAGGAMTGPIAMGGSKITTLADATDDGDAVNFKQMKDANDNYLPLAGGTMTGQLNGTTAVFTGVAKAASFSAPIIIESPFNGSVGQLWSSSANSSSWKSVDSASANPKNIMTYSRTSGNLICEGPLFTNAVQSSASNAFTRKDYVDTKASIASPVFTGKVTTPRVNSVTILQSPTGGSVGQYWAGSGNIGPG